MIFLLIFLSLWLGLLCKQSYILFCLLLLALLLLIYKRFTKKLALICLLTSIFGVGLSHINIEYGKTEYKGVVVDSKENYYILNSFGEKFYIYEKNNSKEVGDILNLKGKSSELSFVTLESEFDFEKYLNSKGVTKQFQITYEDIVFKNPIQPKRIRINFLSNFDENTKQLYSAILFSNSIKGDVIESLKNIGLSRLISCSGVYLYAFLSLLEKITSKIFKSKGSKICSLAVLSFYAVFTFPRFTVIKILFFQVFKLINEYKLNKKLDNLSIIGIGGIFFLLINKYLAYQDSFILGFLIPINSSFIRQLYKKTKTIKKKLSTMIWMYFFFLPFSLHFNYSTNFISFFAQLIITPVFIGSAILGFICFFRIPIYGVCNLYTNVILFVAKTISLVSFSIHLPEFNTVVLLLYYFLYYLLLYYTEIKFLPIMNFLKICYVIVLSIYILPIKNAITQEIDFINVGQGDCCLIRDGNTTTLIDTGGLKYKDLATSSLIPYFKKKRLYNIDLVITTHDDFDHCGALESLQENFKVKNVINNSTFFPLAVGNLSITNYNVFLDSESDENYSSLVLGFNLLNKDFLLMGDAPIEIEKKIMKEYDYIPCDILKVGHHGSNTSTCDDFIKYLSPKEAIISVGKNNYYDHPTDSVLKILKTNGVVVKRTDLLGTISYSNYKFL